MFRLSVDNFIEQLLRLFTSFFYRFEKVVQMKKSWVALFISQFEVDRQKLFIDYVAQTALNFFYF